MREITAEQMRRTAAEIDTCMRVFAAFAPDHKTHREDFFSLINGDYRSVSTGSGQGSYFGKGELTALYDPKADKVYFTLTEPVGMSDHERHNFIPDYWRWRLFFSLRKIKLSIPEAEVYVVPADIVRFSSEQRVREKIAKVADTPPFTFKAHIWDYPRLTSTARKSAQSMLREINIGMADRWGEYEYFFRQAMDKPLRAILDFEDCYADRDWKAEPRRVELNRYLTEGAASLIRKLASSSHRHKDIMRIWEMMQGFWDETSPESAGAKATVLSACELVIAEQSDTAAFFQRPERLLETPEFQQYLKIAGVNQDVALCRVAPTLIDAFARRITEELASTERSLKEKKAEETVVVADLPENAQAELAEIRAMYQRRVKSTKILARAVPHEANLLFERIKKFCISKNLLNETAISRRLQEIERAFAAFQTSAASA